MVLLVIGSSNTTMGVSALSRLGCTLLGPGYGDNNTALGVQAGANLTRGSGNVYIGALMYGDPGLQENDHTYVRNINTTSVSGGFADTVTVDLSTGLLGHLTSSRRHKEDIKPMDKASEALYRLKPVTFRFKKEIDPSQSLEYGLVAEDVAQVDRNLAILNGKGQIESLRYNAISAMLLNEFLKEHRKVEDLKKDFQAAVAQQRKEIAALTATVKEQAAQIQKVSAQLEASKFAPQMVNNP